MMSSVLSVATKKRYKGNPLSRMGLAQLAGVQYGIRTGELSLSSIKLRTRTISSADGDQSLTGKGYSLDLRYHPRPLSDKEIEEMSLWGVTRETKATFINEGGYIETTATKKANVLSIGTSLLGGGL